MTFKVALAFLLTVAVAVPRTAYSEPRRAPVGATISLPDGRIVPLEEPTILLTEQDWEALDAEITLQQTRTHALEAEVASLQSSLKDSGPSWQLTFLLGALALGLGVGMVATR